MPLMTRPNKATLKTGNKNVQRVLQHCCRAMLRVLPLTFRPVLHQIKVALSCVTLKMSLRKCFHSNETSLAELLLNHTS